MLKSKPIPRPIETAHAAHPGAGTFQKYLREALQNHLDIKVPNRPMRQRVQVVLSTADMEYVYVRRRLHMVGRTQTARAMHVDWIADIHHSEEAWPRSHTCVATGCKACVPRVAYVFWSSDVHSVVSRRCLESTLQTAGLQIKFLTYEPDLCLANFVKADVESAEDFMAKGDFQKYLSSGVSEKLLAQFITVSACVQRGGGGGGGC